MRAPNRPARRTLLGLALFGGTRASDVLAAAAGTSSSAPRAAHLTFTLPRAATTSAGVYDREGRLVRTLWRAEPLAAGRHERRWDGRNDQAQAVGDEVHEFRLLHHTLNYVWEGVIGNSSGSFGGPQLHKAYLPPSSIVISGDRAIYAVGYNEQQPGLHGFLLSAPEKNTRPLPSIDPYASYAMIAGDATRLYWANTGGLSPTSFVGAFDLARAQPADFSAGAPVCLFRRQNSNRCYESQDYKSVIALETDASKAPVGLAVQRSGRVLAVAHGHGRVRLFDKLSGELLREFTLPLAAKALNQIAMTPGGDLWIISGNTVLRYTDLERLPSVAATISGLTRPLALATHPLSDDILWVADGGASQQLKRFDRGGRAVSVIGRPGGYTSDPLVAPDKLCFASRDGREQTAMALSVDGQLWAVDYGNNRMLRFRTGDDAAAGSDAQIAYLPGFYTSSVDHADPRRVFANFLEFEADTTTPLVPGRSWKLVRNWLPGLPRRLVDAHAFNAGFGGLNTVATLSNGRTYGIVSAHRRQAIVELPASGPLRLVRELGAELPGTTQKVLYPNGDLGYALTGPTTQRAMRLMLTGFDSAGDPQWSAEPVVLASVPISAGSPHYRGAFSGTLPPRFPVTGSGKVIFFDQSVTGNEGFHLGAAVVGATGWLWQASPTGPLDGKGSFQTRAVDGSLHYGGNVVWASGRHIVYGYHGEFYKDLQTGRVGQANQFVHFDESGLFLGQFGQPSTRPAPPGDAGMSGNALSPTLVRIGARLHLYHNDESTHGGVHRWRIDGWDDVQALQGSGRAGGSVVLK